MPAKYLWIKYNFITGLKISTRKKNPIIQKLKAPQSITFDGSLLVKSMQNLNFF